MAVSAFGHENWKNNVMKYVCYCDCQVIHSERHGCDGYGVVVDDIKASAESCMNKILDFPNYPKFISSMSDVNVYESYQEPEVSAIVSISTY